MHWGADYGMGLGFGGGFMIFFWILVLVIVIFLIRSVIGNSKQETELRESAEDVLKKRFARGEMSQKEFEEAMAVLKRHQ